MNLWFGCWLVYFLFIICMSWVSWVEFWMWMICGISDVSRLGFVVLNRNVLFSECMFVLLFGLL